MLAPGVGRGCYGTNKSGPVRAGQCRAEFCPERPVPVLVEAHTDLPVRCDLGAEHDNVLLLRCPQLADPSASPFTDTGGTCSSRRTSRQQRQGGWPAPVWCGSTSPSCATGHLRRVRSSAHSNLHAQSPALLRHSLTDVCHLDILSRRCVRANITCPPMPELIDLQGPALVDGFARRARSRWSGPRRQVRCSGRSTRRVRARADCGLRASVTGPHSRLQLSQTMINGFVDIYSSSCVRWCATRGLERSQ